ncbi:benzoate/H(+) symporter BenE family transporter [Paenibacillus sp. ATY16]|uniref:benzoate/H(+) symporter BenE family transporter n=1 Tax=Paenibacillus sp. ATY16 TaxID=1759312 RepID=UPI00200F53BC|nr:benzoate/H(+) symporter BenE family transporter [Paenibacillus sp. ATY16]MCK9859522.1 benzoate/H(+) symporter BenE family transporter [Paenibacillus sp. ATY16]
MRFFTTGIMSAMLACTGGAILLVQAADRAGMSDHELLSWFFAVYVAGGVLNTILTLKYKMPFAGAHSITGIAYIGSIAAHYTLPELAGGFILSGVIMIAAGSTGIFGRALPLIPKPIIDALLAGLLLSYVWGMIPSSVQLPLCGILAAAGYWLIPRYTRFLSPALWAMIMGFVGLLLQQRLPWAAVQGLPFELPAPIIPEFSTTAIFSIAIPLSFIVMSNDLAVALTALKSHEYDPSVNRVISASGLASVAAGLFGGHAANVGGMMTALCSSPETGWPSRRIGAAITSNVLVILFGLFASKLIGWIQILPAPFIALMTGIPLLGLFMKSVKSAVQLRPYIVPSTVTFVLAASHLHLFGISAPLWALLAGVVLLYVRQKFANRKGGMQDEV